MRALEALTELGVETHIVISKTAALTIKLELDRDANDRVRAEEAVISTPRSKVEVRVIPTNEEIIIARNAWAKLSALN